MIAGNGSTESVSATEGSMLSLDCSVQDAVGGVVFQWQRIKDGGTVVELEEQVGVQITSTPNASSLLLHQVKVADEGMYCCVAADFISRINKHFTVTVKGEQCSEAQLSSLHVAAAKFVRSKLQQYIHNETCCSHSKSFHSVTQYLY